MKECRPGVTISLSTGREDDTWYVRGSDDAGVERFGVSLKLENLP